MKKTIRYTILGLLLVSAAGAYVWQTPYTKERLLKLLGYSIPREVTKEQLKDRVKQAMENHRIPELLEAYQECIEYFPREYPWIGRNISRFAYKNGALPEVLEFCEAQASRMGENRLIWLGHYSEAAFEYGGPDDWNRLVAALQNLREESPPRWPWAHEDRKHWKPLQEDPDFEVYVWGSQVYIGPTPDFWARNRALPILIATHWLLGNDEEAQRLHELGGNEASFNQEVQGAFHAQIARYCERYLELTDHAIQEYEHALEIEPTSFYAAAHVSALYKKQGNPERAREIIETLERLNWGQDTPGHVTPYGKSVAWLHHGEALILLGDPEGGLESLQKTEDIGDFGQENIAWSLIKYRLQAYSKLGWLDKVEELVSSLEGDRARWAQHHLAWAYLENGHLDDARKTFLSAALSALDWDSIYSGLGFVHLEKGDLEAARRYLLRGLYYSRSKYHTAPLPEYKRREEALRHVYQELGLEYPEDLFREMVRTMYLMYINPQPLTEPATGKFTTPGKVFERYRETLLDESLLEDRRETASESSRNISIFSGAYFKTAYARREYDCIRGPYEVEILGDYAIIYFLRGHLRYPPYVARFEHGEWKVDFAFLEKYVRFAPEDSRSSHSWTIFDPLDNQEHL